MPPNRIVALFTPLIAVAAGGAAAWLADNVGMQVSQGELETVFVAALLAVVAPAAQWLHGSQKYERHQQDLDAAALEADAQAAALASDVDAYDDDGYDDAYDDYDDEDEYGEDVDAEDDEVDDDYVAARDENGHPAPVGA